METQSYHHTVTLAPHHDPFYASAASYPLHSDQYLPSTGGEVEFATTFLGGSSPTYPNPHEDYHRHGYGLHRGELLQLSSYHRVSEELSSTTNSSTISPELDATGGLGFTRNNANNTNFNNGTLFSPAEDLALFAAATNGDYGHGCWSSGPSSTSSIPSQAQGSGSTTVPNALHGVVAPVPVLPSPPEATFLPKSKEAASFVRAPDPPLPTPAAMAVLLSSNGSGSGSGSSSGAQSVYDISSPVLMGAGGGVEIGIGGLRGQPFGVSTAVVPRDNAVTVGAGPAVPASQHEGTSREKKHACTMCHKRFDRPSTLRKHLLVHTGEKAFVCDICGRRFGVASNLNRHVKRCALKPVNMTACSPPKSSSDSDETSPRPSPTTTSPERSLAHGRPIGSSGKRGSVSSVSSCSSSRGRNSMSPLLTTNGSTTGKGAPAQKRRRRAPSPSRWVPMSLLNFNLVSEDMYRSVSVPLPPVRRNLPQEERDSWDENLPPTPYHPSVWKGVLPGPGLPSLQALRGKDMSKLPFNGHGSGTGTFMVSRVVARAV